MNAGKDRATWQSKRNLLVIVYGVSALVVVTGLIVFASNIFETSQAGEIPQVLWFGIVVILWVTFLLMLSRISKILDALGENNTKLERIAEALEKNRSVLAEIEQKVRLSDAAKSITFGDADKRSLREAVFDKLEQRDFVAAYEIIDEVASRTGYKELAKQLREQANKYRDTTGNEKIKQAITDVERLFQNHEWAEASAQIEELIKAYPNCKEAKTLRSKLLAKKEERKKILLTSWEDAVQRRATDRSLEILKELDTYLSPNEGLALQEAAKDVFKTKLHNLGVQFSLAVSGKNWAKAIEVGEQITRDFPNSKVAEELRAKLDVLKQKLAQQGGQ